MPYQPKIYNRVTGELVEVDPRAFRVTRLARRIYKWADTVNRFFSLQDGYRCVMLTLTYKNIDDWRPNHIRDFLLALRKRTKIFAYAWVMELQERGAPHYHVLVMVQKGTDVPMPDKTGLWTHGLTRRETARHMYYICKYTSKGLFNNEHSYPKGARIFGVWLSLKVIFHLEILRFKISSLPAWLRDIAEKLDPVIYRRIIGGGWQDDVGRRYFSPFEVLNPRPKISTLGRN